jgi:hypothetical protein
MFNNITLKKYKITDCNSMDEIFKSTHKKQVEIP